MYVKRIGIEDLMSYVYIVRVDSHIYIYAWLVHVLSMILGTKDKTERSVG
jgi:hypothetical protein